MCSGVIDGGEATVLNTNTSLRSCVQFFNDGSCQLRRVGQLSVGKENQNDPSYLIYAPNGAGTSKLDARDYKISVSKDGNSLNIDDLSIPGADNLVINGTTLEATYNVQNETQQQQLSDLYKNIIGEGP
jgi:hypothetical protein